MGRLGEEGRGRLEALAADQARLRQEMAKSAQDQSRLMQDMARLQQENQRLHQLLSQQLNVDPTTLNPNSITPKP